MAGRRDRPVTGLFTETVYRHVIAPAIRGGASVMDDIFGDQDEDDGETRSA